MLGIKPHYLIALLFAVILVVFLKLSNPYRQYSTTDFWQQATVEDAVNMPVQALQAGNKNGPVLMWAAMATSHIEILRQLVEMGADVNEHDLVFKGTPLTGAAGYSKYPEVIRELMRLGADIEQTVNNDETPLMIAARYNQNPGIITELLRQGSKIDQRNESGETALDLAKLHNNDVAIAELQAALQ